MYQAVVFFLALASQALAQTIQCKPYTSHTLGASSGRVYVSNYGPKKHPNLPAYTGDYSPWQALKPNATGAAYSFKTCNATSLGLTGPTYLDNTCYDNPNDPPGNGCTVDIQNYIQIIKADGRCLTVKYFDSTTSELVWRTCDYNAQNASQLFATDEHINCIVNDSAPGGCGSPGVSFIDLYPRYLNLSNQYNWNWELASDKDTLLVQKNTDEGSYTTVQLAKLS